MALVCATNEYRSFSAQYLEPEDDGCSDVLFPPQPDAGPLTPESNCDVVGWFAVSSVSMAHLSTATGARSCSEQLSWSDTDLLPTQPEALFAAEQVMQQELWAFGDPNFAARAASVMMGVDKHRLVAVANLAHSAAVLGHETRAFVRTCRAQGLVREQQRINDQLARTGALLEATTREDDGEQAVMKKIAAFANQARDLCDELVLMLRLEAQLACFHFFHQISQCGFDDGAGSNPAAAGATRQPIAGKEPSHKTAVAGLQRHLAMLHDAVDSVGGLVMWELVVTPLVRLVPRLAVHTIGFLQRPVTSKGVLDLTRLAATLQQMMVGLTHFVLDATKTAKLNEGFARLRTFVSMLSISSKDLVAVQKQHRDMFSREEHLAMWLMSGPARSRSAAQQSQLIAEFNDHWRAH